VRVQCLRKESSRSLSHLMMSLLRQSGRSYTVTLIVSAIAVAR